MIFKVAPEETEDGEEAKIAVVWEFDHASGMTAAAYAVRREEKPTDGLVIMPRLVFGKVNCNCTRFPHLGDVIVSSRDETETVSQYLQNLDLGSESNGEEDLSDNEYQELSSGDSDDTDADNVELFTETMNLKGSSYHSSFQSHLRLCKEALMKSEIRNNSQRILKINCEKSENRFSVNRNQKSYIPKTEIRNRKSDF